MVGFINLLTPADIEPFYNEFNARKWDIAHSQMLCTIAFAKLQGVAELISRFRSAVVARQDVRSVFLKAFLPSAIHPSLSLSSLCHIALTSMRCGLPFAFLLLQPCVQPIFLDPSTGGKATLSQVLLEADARLLPLSSRTIAVVARTTAAALGERGADDVQSAQTSPRRVTLALARASAIKTMFAFTPTEFNPEPDAKRQDAEPFAEDSEVLGTSGVVYRPGRDKSTCLSFVCRST